MTIPERYLELALRLAKHEPELVFGYAGPAELAERIAGEDKLAPAELAAEAEDFLGELTREEQNPRTRWLLAQASGLATFAHRLNGAGLSYREEVERSYGVEPVWYPEEEFAEAHRVLDGALPGEGDLAPRYERWLEETAIPPEKLEDALAGMLAELRERTRALFGLPAGEEVELRLVSGKRWGGYSEFLGGLRSILHVNTDLPLPAADLAHFVAHEAYPGHHTENAWKEAVLVREQGCLEATIVLASGSEAVIAEGLAQLAPDVVLGAEAERVAADVLQRVGVNYDAEIGEQVRAARMVSNDVAANLALMRHEQGAGDDELYAYARRWTLQPEARVRKHVAWVSTQPFRGYVVTYPAGLRLARAFVGDDPDRFNRLLTEQLTPADLRLSSSAA